MIAASALLTAEDATPALAAAAVRTALKRLGRREAQEVILFLTPEFARLAGPTLAAVSRAAGCLQIFGGIAAGVVSDEAWSIDRPAVAALVLADLPARSPRPAAESGDGTAGAPIFSLCGKPHLPAEWLGEAAAADSDALLGRCRFGLLYNDALSSRPSPVWQGARLCAGDHASLRFDGCDAALGLSTGLSMASDGELVESADGHDLIRLGGVRALDSLRQALPARLRQNHPLPVHCICAEVHADGEATRHPVAILSANADGTVTLAEPVAAGAHLCWSLRLPADAEADMVRMLDELALRNPQPGFGLFLSCIGRGPFFYAGEDRDWALFRQRFPGLPFVGAYGSGQIFSADHQHRLLQNSVIAALFTA